MIAIDTHTSLGYTAHGKHEGSLRAESRVEVVARPLEPEPGYTGGGTVQTCSSSS